MKRLTKGRWFVIGALALLCTLCFLTACGARGEGPMTSMFAFTLRAENTVTPDEVVGDPADVSEVKVDDLRIQLLSDTVLRIEERSSDGTFENRASYLVPDRSGWEPVEFDVQESEGTTLISVKDPDSLETAYVVHVPVDNPKAESVYVTDGAGKRLWEFDGMTTTNMYLPSPSDELRSWYFTESPRVIPSEYGYSGESDEPLQGWEFDSDAVDAYVFLPGGSYEQFTSDYVKLTGRSEMVSLQMLGFWDSRYYAYSAETALQQIKDYTDRGYAIDVLVIDTDWRNGTSGSGYEINTDLFPNMAEFLQDCHDLGVNVCFNDHPDPLSDTENSLDKEEVQFRKEHLTLLLSLGVDYWWYDRNWTTALKPIDEELSVYAFGMYAYNWITDEYLQSVKDLNGYAERALMMANIDGCQHGVWTYASDISAHRYSIQWTGDIHADEDDLAQEIYTTIFGGAEVGIPYISSDLGGHNQKVTNELYGRWFQYGALSAICRVHCMKNMSGQPGRMPWIYGETAEGIAHTYQDMRYRLLPLYYDLARQNYDTGLPVIRRLDIAYPQYAEASRNDEYLLGDYILIAPISTAEKGEDGVVSDTRTVFLPEGSWIDVWSGKRYVGPATVEVTHPIETSPIFVREGALVVLAENMINTSEKLWDNLTLDVYPSINFEAYTRLYEDDVTTDAYQHGEYRTTDISMKYVGGKMVLTIGAAEGSFKGERAFDTRTWNVRLHKNEDWGDIVSVKVNGKTVSLAKYLQDSDAEPFAFSGAAADGDVYEFRFSGSVDKQYTIEFEFENMTDSKTANDYNASKTAFSFTTGDAGLYLDLTQQTVVDFISVGDNGSVDDVNVDEDGPGVFSVPTSYEDGTGTIYEEIWTDASAGFIKKLSEYETSYSYIVSQKDFAFTIDTSKTDAKYFILYLGGTQCTAKVTVRDRSGNYVQTESFGNRDGSFMQRVVIECTGEERGVLYVTYSMLSSELVGFEDGMSSQVHAPSPSNVYFFGAVAATEIIGTEEEVPHVNITANIASENNAPASANLTTIGRDLFGSEETLDWLHFDDVSGYDQKSGGTALANTAFSPAGLGFNDFTTSFTYSDAEGESIAGAKDGWQTLGTITVNVLVDENTSHIVIYTGAYNNTNQLTVWSQGEQLCAAEAFSGSGSPATTKCIVIEVNAEGATTVTIRIEAQNLSSGNVSLAAAAVTGSSV